MQTREQIFGDLCGDLTRMITRMKFRPEACHLRLIVQDRSLKCCLDQTFGACPYSTGLPRKTLFVECCSREETCGAVLKRLVEEVVWSQTTVWLFDLAANNVTVLRQGQDPQVVEGTIEHGGEGAFKDLRWSLNEFFASTTEDAPVFWEREAEEDSYSGGADCSDGESIPF